MYLSEGVSPRLAFAIVIIVGIVAAMLLQGYFAYTQRDFILAAQILSVVQ